MSRRNKNDKEQGVSQATMLIQDIVDGILESGKPPYPDSMFVDEGFQFFEPKKKERLLGSCPLYFPKGCYVGIFTRKEPYQFRGLETLELFLAGVESGDPYMVRDLVKEKFGEGCPVGIAGGYGNEYPASLYNVFWLDEKTRFFYDPYLKEFTPEIFPKVIIV